MTKPHSEPTILTSLLPVSDGRALGVLTLNAPKAMNAVDLDMVNAIDAALLQWQHDPKVVAVFMHGAGDKAFSAGGDIRKLYDSMQADGEQHLKYGDAFFLGEYSKNYRVHYFNKPLIAWGQGFVMGGGLGLYIAANHRVATENLKLAWPEVRIGLFPDVAGSWWLSRLPKNIGRWMALSGSHMNARDCQSLKLVHYCLQHQQQQEVMQALVELPWQRNLAENHALVRQLLQRFERPAEMPASELDDVESILQRFFKDDNLPAIDKAMRTYRGKNPWIKQGIQNFINGCPATAHVIMRQLQQGANMSLKEVVRWELAMAYQSLRHPDFAEGIRAMVVDKDFKPQWQHVSVADVPSSWVDELCSSPWPAEQHPLHQLAPF